MDKLYSALDIADAIKLRIEKGENIKLDEVDIIADRQYVFKDSNDTRNLKVYDEKRYKIVEETRVSDTNYTSNFYREIFSDNEMDIEYLSRFAFSSLLQAVYSSKVNLDDGIYDAECENEEYSVVALNNMSRYLNNIHFDYVKDFDALFDLKDKIKKIQNEPLHLKEENKDSLEELYIKAVI